MSKSLKNTRYRRTHHRNLWLIILYKHTKELDRTGRRNKVGTRTTNHFIYLKRSWNSYSSFYQWHSLRSGALLSVLWSNLSARTWQVYVKNVAVWRQGNRFDDAGTSFQTLDSFPNIFFLRILWIQNQEKLELYFPVPLFLHETEKIN